MPYSSPESYKFITRIINYMTEYDFSVIIPTLHEEKTIEKTLSSICEAGKASKCRVEAIVVDGASKDRTVEIAERYADKILLLEDRGVAKARNLGAKHARGDILAFLDADVVVPRNFFDELYTRFVSNGLSGAGCRVMPHEEVSPSRFERTFYSLWHGLKRVSCRIKPCSTGENGIIVKRDVFNRVNGFNESLDAIEDLDFVLRASKHGRFAYLGNLTIHETIRRFRKLGAARFSRIYISNFLHYLLFKRSRIKEWNPVR
jgi:glycosyltransferase involved in cell wall biosynthesis